MLLPPIAHAFGLVYVTALWETEHDRLLRDRGLPRAILRRSRIR